MDDDDGKVAIQMLNRISNNRSASKEEGTVDAVVAQQEWRIKFHGVYWHARAKDSFTFSPGDTVRIVGREDLKLLIAPL